MTRIAIETLKVSDTKELRIFHDEDAESPRTAWDNLGTMVCFHRKYTLGDKHDYRSEDFNSFEELREQIEKDYDVAAILPVYLLDHSGLMVSTTPFGCPWDSGQIGWIFIDKETVRREYSVKKISKILLNRIQIYLTGEVETYDTYLRGEVYGYQLIEKSTCKECQHVSEEVIDSCWGFYGSNHKESGILDCLEPDERERIITQF